MTSGQISELEAALGLKCSAFARLLGVSERTVFRWKSTGVPPGTSAGVAAALARWLAKPKSAPVVRAIAHRADGLEQMMDSLFDALTTVEYLKLH